MAFIERRPPANGKGLPRYRARVKGHGRTLTSTHPDRHSAVQWAAETEARLFKEGPRNHDNSKRPMRELIDRYTEYVLPLKRNGPNQRHQLQWWRQRIGKIPVEKVTRSLIAQCRDELGKAGQGGKARGPATVVRYLAVLSHLFSVAIGDWEWADVNPVRGVRKPREPRGRDRYLSEQERTKLLEACKNSTSPDLHAIVLLALCSGMRRGEIMTLEWGDIDLVRRVITLRETKNGSRRSVPLCSPAYEAILERSKVRRLDTSLVFASEKLPKSSGDTVKPRDITKPWETARQRAGLKDFRFHDLRHSAASYMAMSGATTLEIAAVLGHRTLQMTQRYSHLNVEHLRSVIQRATQGVADAAR